MKSAFIKMAFILVLWLPFSAGGIVAIVASFFAILFDHQVYGKNLLRAMDKTLAAVCGFSGFYTLSAECGIAPEQPWIALRNVLDMIEPGHCEGAARNERLIP